MSGWDAHLRLNTPKLQVPSEFIPTRPHDRGWIIPFFDKNPIWTIPAAILPAIIATILIFMDQQITAVIINRKEFNLKVTSSRKLRHFRRCSFVVEKIGLSFGSVRSVVHHSHSVAVGSAVVRRCHRPGLDARQRLENDEREHGTR